MPRFRRRSEDPAVAAFRATATHVDAAQRALIASVPTARDPGIPLGDAIAEFRRHLERARETLGAWRTDRFAHEWTKCSGSIEAALASADALADAGPLGFEALNARVGEVLAPLDAFADASIVLRRR